MPAYKYTLKDGKTTHWRASVASRHSERLKNMNVHALNSRITPVISAFLP